jgi:protein ImuA
VRESLDPLTTLRQRIAALETSRPVDARGRVLTGHAGLDAALGGGFARRCVHELFGGGVEDAGEGSAFGLMLARLAARQAGDDGEASGAVMRPVFWLRTTGASRMGGVPYGPGLVELGMDPADMLLGTMADEAMLLRAAVDALRCPELGALVMECWGMPRLLDLTASRRLALAAEESGVMAILLMNGAEPAPSAAETRWRVLAAPSVPLPGNAPGMSAFDLTLLRRRAGRDGMAWRIMWDGALGQFVEWGAGENGRDGTYGHGMDPAGDDDATRAAGAAGRTAGGGGAPLSGAVVPLSAVRSPADRAA